MPTVPQTHKTGPKPKFSVDDAVAATMKLDLNHFTLSDVARELGTSTPSLYRVVESRDQLIHLCLESWVHSVVLPDPGLTWQDQLRAFATMMWEGFQKLPSAPSALMNHPETYRYVFAPIRVLINNLEQAGMEGGKDHIAFAVDFIGDTVQMSFLSALAIEQSSQKNAESERELSDRSDMVSDFVHHAVGGENDSGDTSSRPPQTVGETDSARSDNEDGGPEWTYGTWLQRKVDFLIAGLEAGL